MLASQVGLLAFRLFSEPTTIAMLNVGYNEEKTN